MTTAASQYPIIGAMATGNANAFVEVASGTGYTPVIPLGSIQNFIDPYWGAEEVIRLQIPVSTAVSVGQASTLNNTYSYVALPNTANMGQAFAVAMNAVPSDAVNIQYAWFAIAGRRPFFSTASVAADTAFGITAAGKFGAISNGKQILSARVQAPATTTVVKVASVISGKNTIQVNNTDGWFVGLPVTGTGIPAATTISSIDQNNRTVRISNAATSTISTNVTATYNDGGSNFWNIVDFQRPSTQGQIV